MRFTQGVAHHVIGVVVDVLVRSAVDREEVSAPLIMTGGSESGIDLDVIIADPLSHTGSGCRFRSRACNIFCRNSPDSLFKLNTYCTRAP